MKNKNSLSRRRFLQAVGVSGLYLSCSTLRVQHVHAGKSGIKKVINRLFRYDNFTDLYRQKWQWDRIAKGTHFVNCWYQRGCCWNVYVKEGVVFREEQVASYPQTNAEVPDFNPRGCQKGACYSARMTDASRVLHPLKRVGERGEGKWRRVSWDEAFTAIADKMIDVITDQGPEAIIWDPGTGSTNGCNAIGLYRSAFLLDTPVLDLNSEIGDHHPGSIVTTGKIIYCSSADDLFYSDLILIWGGNPVYTQIPNAHFINEARYKGAKVICIAPDYNASSIHADEWIGVNIGTDAALGLALSQVIVEEGLHDEAFIKEQTDQVLLVRDDNGRFLRESDMESGGGDEQFYCYDLRTSAVKPMPKKSLSLEEVDPALEGKYTLRTLNGDVVVRPAFMLLRKQMAAYTPEKSEVITGIQASVIRHLARTVAKADAASLITQSNFGKFYHGVEMERAQMLVMSLCGHIGKKGSGIAGFPFMQLTNIDALNQTSGKYPPAIGMITLALSMAPEMVKLKLKGYTDEMMLYEFARQQHQLGSMVNAPLYYYRYGGLEESFGGAKKVDPAMKRSYKEHLDEALEKGWQHIPDTPPKIFFEAGGNMLRRVRHYHKMIDGFLPKLDLVVTIDWRMSNTARYSDYVLPAAGWYEKDDITWGTPIAPFAHAVTRAVDPLGESKNDWDIHCLLLKTLQKRAKERGVSAYPDRHGKERRLDTIYDDFTFGERFTESNMEAMLEQMFELADNVGDATWQEVKEKGYVRYTGVGMGMTTIGNAADFEPNKTITANTWHTDKKVPWPTATRRLQFYIDHDTFFELGEELPVHKDNPSIGGDYPFSMTGGHARWSIHSSWRDEQNLLRLQRGEPIIIMGKQDADQRGLLDADPVRVWNDAGDFEARLKVSATVRPGQVIVYHGWEPFQFKGNKSHQSVTPSPLNPIQTLGGYYQLRPMIIAAEPGLCDRGTRVDIAKV